MHRVIRDPEPQVAVELLQTILGGYPDKRGPLVQILARCEVRYRGRAQSTLLAGDRLILIKPDGTLLVHGSKGAKPLNWQPPGANFAAEVRNGIVVLTAVRKKPEEFVEAKLLRIDLITVHRLEDPEELAVTGTEADLQELLFARPDLVEPGFKPQRRERNSERGYYDLDGDDAHGNRLIVEVKRGTAGIEDAQQLWRYVEKQQGGQKPVRGILVAAKIAPKARAILKDHSLAWKELEWAELLPQIHDLQRTGQASLSRFDDE